MKGGDVEFKKPEINGSMKGEAVDIKKSEFDGSMKGGDVEFKKPAMKSKRPRTKRGEIDGSI